VRERMAFDPIRSEVKSNGSNKSADAACIVLF